MLSQRTFVNVSTGNVRGGGTRLSTIGTSAVFGVPFSAIVVLCVEKSVQMNSWNASIRGLEIEIDRFTTRIEVEAHGMVHEANSKAAASEKALKEARMQVICS